MRRLILLTLVSSLIFAQATSDMFTGGLSNGRAWNIFPGRLRSYIIAIRQMSYQSILDKSLKFTWAEKFTADDYIRELNTLYKDTENIRLPICFCRYILHRQIGGRLIPRKKWSKGSLHFESKLQVSMNFALPPHSAPQMPIHPVSVKTAADCWPDIVTSDLVMFLLCFS